MNCIEPVPSGSSTSPIRPSLPGTKRPQSQRALDGTALQVSAMKLPMPIRESIAPNPSTRTGQQGIASKSSSAAQPRRQRSKEGHA